MEQYIGEIKMYAGDKPPKGWALCDGQLLPISENQILYNLIGTTYGGDGVSSFALPDLRGRIPIHQGEYSEGKNYSIGEMEGTETVTLTDDNLPMHTHIITATSEAGTEASPENAYPSNKIAQYTQETSALSHMNAKSISYEGGNQPHDNMMPYLAINYIIALSGQFPTQD
ncbi:phage tail protein [Alkaliphilus peptidifermentans]|uniref:Microcystin-dependent protein n=1 Tax=Alkaliphilus peptidifermentans DSM 18978 TaxID=1120976 RepID=A0A1G5JY82_9FIRM|nr:tail fiber protein [Alkaliphilus peptidifermentans]SCY92830.1 Microcystin-dependent protein [Alkaliphilus peptidifermentans DSM 18978]